MAAFQPSIQTFFEAFSEHLEKNFGRPTDEQKKQIREKPKEVRRLDSFARLIIKDDTQNCAAVAFVGKKWYITANNSDGIKNNTNEIIKSIKEGIIINENKTIKTKKARKYLLKTYLQNVPEGNTKKRLEKDVRKFLSIFKSNIYNAEKNISRISKCSRVKNSKGFHAEISLIRHILIKSKYDENKTPIQITLGISKLCCRLCAATINAVTKTHCHIDIKVKGRHGNFYFAWLPPYTLLIRDKKCFENFVGEKAYEIYSHSDIKKEDKQKITGYLIHFKDQRDFLKDFFKSQRGGVNINSESPVPKDTTETPTEDSEEASSTVSAAEDSDSEPEASTGDDSDSTASTTESSD